MPKKYSQECLQKALEEVRSKKLTEYEAHKKYDIPKATLNGKLKGKHGGKHGKETVLSCDLETQLANWICLCAASGCPKTTREILEAAQQLASLNGKGFKGGIPSSGWLDGFMKRHPDIAKRTPEPLGKASAGLTYDQLKGYFDYLQHQFKEGEMLELLHRPESWWNVDETNFVMNPVPKKVYAKRGAKVVYNVERGKPKENITCTYAVSATGSFIPPLITFKDSFNDLVTAATISGSIGANFGFNQTESGWMKGEAFFNFVTQHLNPRWIELEIPRPIALLVDGYSGHHSLKLYKWCLENDVKLVVLYPNSTHILQVLDVAVFAPLKAKYTELYQKWKVQNPDKIFNEIEFVKLLKQTNDEVMNKETIVNGWKSTGLQPFDFNNVKTDRLVLHSETDNVIRPERNDLRTDDSQESNNQTQLSGTSDQNESNEQEIEFANAIATAINGSSLEIPCMGENSAEGVSDAQIIMENDLVLEESLEIEQLYVSSFDFNQSVEVQPPVSFNNVNETKKLVSNARDAVTKLRDHFKETDPSKLLNLLIMEQQLNIIDPIIINQDAPSTSTATTSRRTVSDILKVPTNIPKPKRTRKGFKVSYGVMSDQEIISAIEKREMENQELAEQRKRDDEAKKDRKKKLLEMKEKLQLENENLKATRNQLKALEAEDAGERKRIAAKRKASDTSKQKKDKQLIPLESDISKPQVKRRNK